MLHMLRTLGILLVTIGSLLWAQATFAQSSQPPSASGPSQVLLFTAVSKDSAPVDLEATDLELKENGTNANVTAVRKLGRLPLHYCVLFDMSGSAKSTFVFQQHEATTVVAKVVKSGTDRGWISLFKEEAQETTEVGDPQQIEGFISGVTPPVLGGTALYDAMAGCARRMAKVPETQRVQRAMFVFSDGGEDASNLALDQTIEILTDAGMHVFAFTPKSDLQRFDKRRLEMLTKQTGGGLFVIRNDDGLSRAVDEIAHELDNVFELSYQSSSTKRGTAKIKMKVRKSGVLILTPQSQSGQ